MFSLLRYRFHRTLSFVALGMATSISAASAVHAAQEIVLIADQSKIVTLPEAPATVVIGNPSVADVTMDGQSLFFHPRAWGLTNVVALDAKGRKLGDYLVRVIFEDRYSVSMYSPAGRKTYTCPRDCEPALRIGDSAEFSGNYVGQAGQKSGLALGQVIGDAMTAQQTGAQQVTTQPMVTQPVVTQPTVTTITIPTSPLPQ
ncbi:MAG: pilus assembly protein N-terminal domain-containing protein [Aestuariivirga sp.]|uniref:pilus assembly protein N-terminal domain-containing protein n=1 Tax=Aestuariivirga sp. TaxID=2650926 RepID=UPI0025C0E4A7|nr:pilus assembly protein N-terminal domain-containing protein [Aestuariivirga sp.]MCA3561944.1 pilus assembly protein N-terminal domain-containing protein [Aestuariivirga sp.]